VTYLLDVNALLALMVREHEFHARTTNWIRKAADREESFATCPITELGFLRVLLQASYGAATVQHGQRLLKLLKASSDYHFQFITDDQHAGNLPGWVQGPKQVTDGHLLALAKAHGIALATLDQTIRSAYLIPR
jgi:uncharacterized protein